MWQFAKEKGIRKMTFDNSEELKKIAAIFPESELVLRALPETHAQSSTDLGKVATMLAMVRMMMVMIRVLLIGDFHFISFICVATPFSILYFLFWFL
jgi:diaminopimelate decarboxylase